MDSSLKIQSQNCDEGSLNMRDKMRVEVSETFGKPYLNVTTNGGCHWSSIGIESIDMAKMIISVLNDFVVQQSIKEERVNKI